MGNIGTMEYSPDFVSCPGKTVQETLEHLGMSQSELAERTDRPQKTISEIIHGKAAITPETALQFERVFGVPARFWNNLEQQYREFLARSAERRQLETETQWLQELPLKEMINRGWLSSSSDPVEQLRSILNFFGVASPRKWLEICPAAVFRNAKSFERKPASVAAWLRKGELLAQDISCNSYDETAVKKRLPKLRALTVTRQEIFIPELIRLCSECGVAVVFLQELPGTRLCGAARWLRPDKAFVQLSLRYKTDDQLWFTFFHEIGHILLHRKKDYFIDEKKTIVDEKEKQANEFSSNLLLPFAAYRHFVERRVFTRETVHTFAAQIGIAPGIVVGRLQHDQLIQWNSALNDFKMHYQFE